MDSNFLCSSQRRRSHAFARFHGGKDLSCFQFSFLGVSFSFNFTDPEKEGRVLSIQVVGFMSTRDKGSFDIFLMFKESEKNLIHSVSKLLDFSSSCNKD